jgi:hypothetical protein
MNIVIADDCPGGAHSWQRKSMAKAFVYCGHNVIIWDIHKESVYDCFDLHQPDLLISQTYNVSDALINCINENPAIKVIMKASDYGPINKKVTEKYPVLVATKKEIEKLLKLKELTGKPDFLFIHYNKDYLDQTHSWWEKEGFKVISDLNAADIFEYTNGVIREEYKCDIGYVGGSWNYKNEVLHPYILPLCENFDYNIKIFGNGWSIPQAMGFLPAGEEKDFYSSAKINLCLHEPHSQKYGYDVTEKFFKLAINKSFSICDRVEGLERLYPKNCINSCNTPKEFHQWIYDLLHDWDNYKGFRKDYVENAYKETLSNHTYFDRIENIFTNLELYREANNVSSKKEEIIKRLKL